MHGHKMFCMMNSGKPLTKTIADVLLFNAVDMYDEHRRTQRIKSRKYDGVIESNLEVIELFGIPVVVFEAIVTTEQFEGNEVKFYVRVDDMEGIELGEWMQLQMKVMGPIPFEMLPPEIREKIQSQQFEDDDEE